MGRDPALPLHRQGAARLAVPAAGATTGEDQTASGRHRRPAGGDDFDEDVLRRSKNAPAHKAFPLRRRPPRARAHTASVVYTDTRAGAPPWPAKTQAELDEEFDAVVADWPDDWTEDDERVEPAPAGAGESRTSIAVEDAPEDPRIDDYARLIGLVDGDVERAEALIEAERKRTPAVARSRLIENALLRLQYGQA